MAGMGTSRLPLLATTAATVLALLLALMLAGCSSGDSGPDPEPTAEALAQGLASGDLSGVAFAGTTPATVDQQYADLVSGLGDAKPTVTVDSVAAKGDTDATATLHWIWPLGTGWTYDTTVALQTT